MTNCWPEKWILWGIKIKPPLHIFFDAMCLKHDELYQEWGTEYDRHMADIKFLYYMKKDIARLKWYKRPHYHIWCYIYFIAVRVGWEKHFNYL